MLTEVIKEAKSMHCNKQIIETTNKIKAVSKTVKKKCVITVQKKKYSQ
jgi:hypothetical protein